MSGMFNILTALARLGAQAGNRVGSGHQREAVDEISVKQAQPDLMHLGVGQRWVPRPDAVERCGLALFSHLDG